MRAWWRYVSAVLVVVVLLLLLDRVRRQPNAAKPPAAWRGEAEAPPWAVESRQQRAAAAPRPVQGLESMVQDLQAKQASLEAVLKEQKAENARLEARWLEKQREHEEELQRLKAQQHQQHQQQAQEEKVQQQEGAQDTSSPYMVRGHKAEVCVTYDEKARQCKYHRCGGSADSDAMAPHGLIYRPQSLRSNTMRISGQRGAGSGCLVVHKYKFIVTHVLKSGGSEIKGAFMKWLCGNHDPVCPGVYEVDNCAPSVQAHPDYFIVTFVRNPYSRAISSWAMAVDFMRDKTAQPVEFSKWALDPDRGSRDMGSFLASVHWSPQAMFNANAQRCPVFDFVGHLETLNEDLVRVSKILDVPELIDASVNRPLHKPRVNNAGERAAKERGSRADFYTKEAAQAVTRKFAEDFEIFGFDKTTFMGKKMLE